MRDMIYSILENSDTVSDVTLKNSPNSSTLLLDRADGKGRMTFHTLFPGLTLAFIFVNAPVWPESDENSNLKSAPERAYGMSCVPCHLPDPKAMCCYLDCFSRSHQKQHRCFLKCCISCYATASPLSSRKIADIIIPARKLPVNGYSGRAKKLLAIRA